MQNYGMIKIQSTDIEQVLVGGLTPHPKNMNIHSDAQIERLCKLIEYQGFRNPIVVQKGTNLIVAGHGRLMAAKKLGIERVPVTYQEFESEAQLYAYMVSDNAIAEWAELDLAMINDELKSLPDLNLDMLGIEDFGTEDDKYSGGEKGSMAGNFIAPPFSVLDTRQDYWLKRRKQWQTLGIKSEEGRTAKAFSTGDGRLTDQSDTSIFDPVLCEIIYSWFSSKDGTVLDPFAGGSVRGIIASHLGRQYIGIDLRQEQIEANNAQMDIALEPKPVWHCGDSLNIDKICHDVKADLVFSCPPYADLEVYSDSKNDLSNMAYDEFKKTYFEIIKRSCALLRDDAFACFVVGEVRSKKGNYYNFVSDTISAFVSAGLSFYNEIILVNSIGTLPLRSGKTFKASRKIGKCHQNVLVFLKGDAKKAVEKLGSVEVMELQNDE